MLPDLLVGAAARSTLLGLTVAAVLATLRVRRPRVRMTAWTFVLFVSLATPALTPWRTRPIWGVAVYAAVAVPMVIRILVDLVARHRLVRTAIPLLDSWTGELLIRVSLFVTSPTTVGSTIVLPADYWTWSAGKRRAVVLHEGSHVAHRDFYVLLLASVYRAAFWFNPFAWWLEAHLSTLAETVADDAATVAISRGFAPLEGSLEWRIRRLQKSQ